MGGWLLLLVALVAVDWPTIVKPALSYVVRIESAKADAETPGICSGVIINRATGVVLTAAHCIPVGEPHTYSITVNGRHAQLARANRLIDLAILRIPGESKDKGEMELAAKSPAIGSDVAVVGFLLGSKTIRAQFGRIAEEPDKDRDRLVVDGVVLPGDSGGAIIDASGKLVGLTVQYYQGSAIGLAVPVEAVRDFVEPFLPPGK